jgi:hypothetical protein
MGQTINEVRKRLWQGQDPFGNPMQSHATDKQGWGGSEHPFLSSGIEQLKPGVVIEVGVWKGASVIFMAKKLRDFGLDAVVIAVDTWLGSVEKLDQSDRAVGHQADARLPAALFHLRG